MLADIRTGVSDRSVRLVAEPKPGGRRWISILDPRLAERYRSLVAAVADPVEASLGPEVVANRVVHRSVRPPSLILEDWRTARRRFLRAARDLASRGGVLVLADVRECFASIRPGVVATSLRDAGCDPAAVAAIATFLHDVGRAATPGLPIGPEPSAVLANGVLAAADRAIAATGRRHIRWVDDIVASVATHSDASELLAGLRTALQALDLELAESKTRVLVADEHAGAHAFTQISGPGDRYSRGSDAHVVPSLEGPNPLSPEHG